MNNNNTESEELKEQSQLLLDKCTKKKKKNPKFSSYIEPLVSKKLSERIKECGDFLQMLSDLNLENSKLHRASFCGNRFCPMCSWRIACKDSLEISILMEHLRKEESKEFIFLTLTTPNVKGADLDNSIKAYNKAFKKLMERKEVKSIVKGYIRKLEVTYNLDKSSKSYNTYHPHFHVVLAVNRSYFKKQNLYINHHRWLSLWQESTGDYSITQVDVRKAKINDYKEVYELAKYSAKDSDYLINREVFTVFYKSLKGKQVLVFSGLFKDAHKMYKNGELDLYKKLDTIEYAYMVSYNWLKKKYDTSNIRELTEEEKQKFNKNLIEDVDIE
ncbi:plasmid rolling circle replication initiator protein Rep [Clostridium beijerinckii]|uniref:protein rep n=1 Tax=Clostridium beijerinckii TaxID=1520 RepID=UPI00098C796E|nr:protein rep [Clostridium beijerinckii]MBA8937830.1 plasmid rolling circle replication initiator protein Rep [Clostridium beijerinckii]NSB00896.1 plasmid rolling circle replication initiator protein Rep [Clostridium beijerinckii]OOM64376.1 replication protein [Clostridium beijerinckii]